MLGIYIIKTEKLYFNPADMHDLTASTNNKLKKNTLN